MDSNDKNILIIGAGIAGLTAAIELEKAGLSTTILEGSFKVGGRVKTDEIEGCKLDHGFQVLLTAYPEVNEYLDLNKLDLKSFDPGAIIFSNGKVNSIYDPFRDPSKFLKMVMSPIGTTKDKLLIRKLTQKLKKKKLEEIFIDNNETTEEYLKTFGFSDSIIDNFFRPFFGGIFLENELSTSSRMFEFVFKMFSEGYAAIPANGMGEIPLQLKDQLNKTTIRTNTEVLEVLPDEVVLHSGEKIPFSQLIIATTPGLFLKGFTDQFEDYESVINVYFKTPEKKMKEALIGLVPEKKYIMNNFCDLTTVSQDYVEDGDSLLSVSINGIQLSKTDDIEERIKQELHELAGYDVDKLTHIKTFLIPRALPKIDDLAYQMNESAVKVQENIYLAGDYLLNASLNAAMVSGRTAAHALLANL